MAKAVNPAVQQIFVPPNPGGGGGGGGTRIFSYICRLGHFVGSNFLISIFFFGGGGFRKVNIFWGYEGFVVFLWGHHKIGLYLVPICMHFRVFS